MNAENLLKAAHNEALARNQQSLFTWTKYKEDVKTAKNTIQFLPDKLKHQVMMSIGPKALMPGHIVHTNEFLVSLGSNYFVKKTGKQASEYCDRKIKSCDEMLNKLEEELNLIQNRSKVPNVNDAFGSADRPEIVEHVTEEEDLKWREEHKQKEKEYRKKLAAMRSEERRKIESEKDLWDRLDELELEEELEDELNRLHDGADSDESDDEIEEKGKVKLEDNTSHDRREKDESRNEVKSEEVPESTVTEKKRRKSVIFAEETQGNEVEPLKLHIKHSASNPTYNSSPSCIEKPCDFYPLYLEAAKSKSPVSILKVKKNPNQKQEKKAACFVPEDKEEAEAVNFVSSGFEIPEVKETNKTEPTENQTGSGNRRVSKFKAARMKNKQ